MFIEEMLFHLINEEKIKPYRKIIRKELEERIEGMDMKIATLEVNYWCAQ